MSLVLAGLVVAGTSGIVLVGRWLAKRKEAEGEASSAGTTSDGRDEDEGPSERDGAGTSSRTRGARTTTSEERIEGLVCQLGDVLTRVTGEEAWLAGGVVLSEEVPVAVLFVAPDAGRDRAIYVRAHPRRALFWLEPLDPNAILVGGEAPSSVEHDGVRYERERRLPLRPRRIGVGALNIADAVVVAEYASAGDERLLVLKASSGAVHAFRGVELPAGTYEVVASGASTLDT